MKDHEGWPKAPSACEKSSPLNAWSSDSKLFLNLYLGWSNLATWPTCHRCLETLQVLRLNYSTDKLKYRKYHRLHVGIQDDLLKKPSHILPGPTPVENRSITSATSKTDRTASMFNVLCPLHMQKVSTPQRLSYLMMNAIHSTLSPPKEKHVSSSCHLQQCNNSELTFLVLSWFIKCRTAVDAGIPSNHGQGKVGMREVVHDSKPQISTVSSGSVGTCRAFQTDHQVCVTKRICIMIYPNQNGSQATCHDRVSDTFHIALPPAMNSWSIVSAILVASAALPISFSQSSHGK